jgi:lipid-A-disaccharide synthase
LHVESLVKAINPQFAAPAGVIDLLVVAGEHSGDQHASRMLHQWYERYPDTSPDRVAAMGGKELRKQVSSFLWDMTDHAVVGTVEVLRHYPFFRRLMKETVRWILQHKPAVICLVDYPGFNLRLAAILRKRTQRGNYHPRIVYYISPQLWAWKSHRRFTMARDLDSLSVIFPFETEVYRDTNLSVEYVGHPFVGTEVQYPVRYDPAGPILLLPGSRSGPVQKIFPILARAFIQLRHHYADMQAVVLVPASADTHRILTLWKEAGGTDGLSVKSVEDGVQGGRAVLTSSGTMSLYCALAGIPGAIIYRANPLTFWLGKKIVRIPWLGMVNILLNRNAWPEFLQGNANPSVLKTFIQEILAHPTAPENYAGIASELHDLLQPPQQGDVADWLQRQLQSSAAQ